MNTCRLALVLGDQLSFDLPSLQALNPQRDAVLLAEVTYCSERCRRKRSGTAGG